MSKKVLIWANCQGGAIEIMLKKYHSSLFEISYLRNYDFLTDNNETPKEIPNKMKTCDVFLYQNYSEKPNSEFDINTILNKYLKNDCIRICFPTLHSCYLLFCYETHEPNNAKTKDSQYPHGKFFFGISSVTDLLKNYNYKNCNEDDKKIIIDEICSNCKSKDFINEETILYYKNRSFEFFEKKILTSDVPELYEFIKDNFTKVRLWHNPNHPTGILLNKLVELIFKRLGLTYCDKNYKENIDRLNNVLSDWVMPIFPCVKEYYKLDFDIACCSSWYHPEIKNRKTYITKYLNELYINK